MKNKTVSSYVAGLLVSWLVTILSTLILAGICFKFCITKDAAKFMVLGIYFISNFAGGFVCGKKGKVKKFLKGAFCGLLYFIVLFVISLVAGGGMTENMLDLILTFSLCFFSGMTGGMIS